MPMLLNSLAVCFYLDGLHTRLYRTECTALASLLPLTSSLAVRLVHMQVPYQLHAVHDEMTRVNGPTLYTRLACHVACVPNGDDAMGSCKDRLNSSLLCIGIGYRYRVPIFHLPTELCGLFIFFRLALLKCTAIHNRSPCANAIQCKIVNLGTYTDLTIDRLSMGARASTKDRELEH